MYFFPFIILFSPFHITFGMHNNVEFGRGESAKHIVRKSKQKDSSILLFALLKLITLMDWQAGRQNPVVVVVKLLENHIIKDEKLYFFSRASIAEFDENVQFRF